MQGRKSCSRKTGPGREELIKPCPWFALEAGVWGRLNWLQHWVDGCLSCDEPISHPDTCWKTPSDCKHSPKLNYEADGRLGCHEEGALRLPAPCLHPATSILGSWGEVDTIHIFFQRAPCCFFFFFFLRPGGKFKIKRLLRWFCFQI